MLVEMSGRSKPVILPPYIVPEIAWSRVRALVLPLEDFAPVQPGDALWAREGVTIEERQRRNDTLVLRYAGDKHRHKVPWPKGHAKPAPGYRAPEFMPIQASRYTLVVQSVDHARLMQVLDPDALSAGVTLDGDGYGALGYPFMRPFDDVHSALGFLFDQQHPGRGFNPEVAVIRFHALARNIARHFLISAAGRDAG